MAFARAGVAGRPLTRPSISQIRVGSWTSTCRSSSTLSTTQKLLQLFAGQAQGRTSSLTHPQDPESTDTRRGQDHAAMRNMNAAKAVQSALLANIMCSNELDHELERRGHRFVRYADDVMIFCRSRKAAERTLRHPKPLRGGKAVSETQRTEDEDLPHDGSEPEVPWVWLLAKPRHRESTTASEVQDQMQTAPEAITSHAVEAEALKRTGRS